MRGIWKNLLGGAVLLLSVGLLYFWRLASLTPGLGPQEAAARDAAQSLSQIFSSGVNAPFHLLQYGLVSIQSNQVLGLRLSSVLAGLLFIGLLYFFLRGWFGATTAFFASLIFLATPWVAVTARTAGADVMLLWPIVLLAGFTWLVKGRGRLELTWLFLFAAIALGLYVPGMVWLYLAGLALGWRYLKDAVSELGAVYATAGSVLIVLLAAPLVQALVAHPANLKDLLLIPDGFSAPVESLKSIGWSFLALFWQAREASGGGIKGLPILNLAQIVLLVFGIYALSRRLRVATYYAIALLAFCIVAAGLNNDLAYLNLGFGVLAAFMAAGLRYLYIEWRRVFPLNPFARALAMGLIGLVVGTHLIYGVRYTLAAWPQNPETKKSYMLK